MEEIKKGRKRQSPVGKMRRENKGKEEGRKEVWREGVKKGWEVRMESWLLVIIQIYINA